MFGSALLRAETCRALDVSQCVEDTLLNAGRRLCRRSSGGINKGDAVNESALRWAAGFESCSATRLRESRSMALHFRLWPEPFRLFA